MTKIKRKAAVSKAYKAYLAIKDPALAAYLAEIKRIDNESADDINEVDGRKYQLIK